jgi:hypothetical protein
MSGGITGPGSKNINPMYKAQGTGVAKLVGTAGTAAYALSQIDKKNVDAQVNQYNKSKKK